MESSFTHFFCDYCLAREKNSCLIGLLTRFERYLHFNCLGRDIALEMYYYVNESMEVWRNVCVEHWRGHWTINKERGQGIQFKFYESNKYEDIRNLNKLHVSFSTPWRNTFSVPRPRNYRSFTITLRYTTLGRTPLDKWSARRRDFYLTTDRHPWLRWDSNPQSQDVSSRRPTSKTARPLGSFLHVSYFHKTRTCYFTESENSYLDLWCP